MVEKTGEKTAKFLMRIIATCYFFIFLFYASKSLSSAYSNGNFFYTFGFATRIFSVKGTIYSSYSCSSAAMLERSIQTDISNVVDFLIQKTLSPGHITKTVPRRLYFPALQ